MTRSIEDLYWAYNKHPQLENFVKCSLKSNIGMFGDGTGISLTYADIVSAPSHYSVRLTPSCGWVVDKQLNESPCFESLEEAQAWTFAVVRMNR